MVTMLTERDFNYPTEAELTKRHRNELAAMGKANGTKSIVTIEQEAIMAAKAKTTKGKTSMARGTNGRNAPHSKKALADSRKTTPAAKAKARTKAKKAATKAKAAAVKADDTKIKLLDKKFTFGAEGTARNASWLACAKAKTVGDYIAAGGARKYLARWEKAGAIKLG